MLPGAGLVACPGCYPTGALLALKPLVKASLIAADADVYIDAKSGVSGAGKKPSPRTHFSEVHGSIAAYGIFSHRHGAEIEQELSRPVTFVPHLVPLDRGILETIYTRLRPGVTADTVGEAYARAYDGSPFVRLTGGRPPEIKHVAHTNFCDVGWQVDGGRLVLGVLPGQPGEGRRRTGSAELQRRLRAGRARGVEVTARRRPPVVIKLGGELLGEPVRLRRLATALADVAGREPLVLVHGGGREVDAEMARLGIAKRAVDGLRITDGATLEVVAGVLAGRVNTRLVAALGAAGASAVGLTGADGGLARVRRERRYRAANGTEVDLGFVGRPVGTDPPALLIDLLETGHVPVVASLGASAGGQLFNVNADTLAGFLAARLRARRLIIAGGTAGVLDADGRTIPTVDNRGIDALIGGGQASAGMVAKLLACRAALEGGAGAVTIVDGRQARREMFDRASGTAVVGGRTPVRGPGAQSARRRGR